MRVTQRTMYDSMLGNMQSTLGAYMESNIQGGSQKKINKPSDDPAGTALVLNSRRNIGATEQYQRNVDTAKGWLSLADSTLTQVSSTISQIKTLAEQAATGTMTDENRDQVATQLRQLFGQLLNLSNTQFENKSIFAGHKYDSSAFVEKLAVTTKDPDLGNVRFDVQGKSDSTLKVEFDTDGQVGVTDPINYRWTKDGGKTWNEGQLLGGRNVLDMDGVTVTIPPGTTVKARDPEKDSTATNGTVLFVRPTAEYQGDDNGASAYGIPSGMPPGTKVTVKGNVPDNMMMRLTPGVDVDLRAPGPVTYQVSNDGGVTWVAGGTVNIPNPPTGKVELPVPAPGTGAVELDITSASSSTIAGGSTVSLQPRRTDIMGGPGGLQVNAKGTFSGNTLVRIDSAVDLTAANAPFAYSYSTDGGKTWVEAKAQTTPPATRLLLPGGYMDLKPGLDPATGALNPNLTAGTQMVIHPDRADLNFEIMQDTYLPVNSVGKDIFGGMYGGQVVGKAESNLFETVGDLIAFAENNDQQGVSECLDRLTKCLVGVNTENARFGGMENRLTMAADVLSFEKIDQQQRLSYTEDIDLTTLLTNLAKQELAYNTVLKSSSMIMQLNLTKFV